MTQQEKQIKRYVTAVERRLRLPLSLKVRINGDIGTEIHALLEQGLTVDEVLQRMGPPEQVAASFNEEYGAKPSRGGHIIGWLFLAAALFCALRLLTILLLPLFWGAVYTSDAASVGVIGGADGPTAIFVTSMAFAPLIMNYLPPFLGCLGAFLLVRRGRDAERRAYTAPAVLAGAGIVVWLACWGWLLVASSASIADPTLWFQTLNLMLLPGFWLPIMVLVAALRRCAQASV